MNQLDAICGVIESMTRTVIGSGERIKCILDDDHTIFVNCVHQLLENLHIENKIADLIITAVSSHHKVYTSSCKTLLTLILIWFKMINKLKKEEYVPLSVILEDFHQAVTCSVEHALDIVVSPIDILKSGEVCNSLPVERHIVTGAASSISTTVISHGNDKKDNKSHGRRSARKSNGTVKDEEDVSRLEGHNFLTENLYPQNKPSERTHSVHLQSANLPGHDVHSPEDDDISWFFEDGKELQYLNTQRRSEERLREDNIQFNFEIISEPYYSSQKNQILDFSKVSCEATDGEMHYPSLKCNDDDDDFGCCLEGIKQENKQAVNLETTVALVSPVQELKERLQEICQKSTEGMKTRILNRCRHFTSIASTVKELQQRKNHNQEFEHQTDELQNSAFQLMISHDLIVTETVPDERKQNVDVFNKLSDGSRRETGSLFNPSGALNLETCNQARIQNHKQPSKLDCFMNMPVKHCDAITDKMLEDCCDYSSLLRLVMSLSHGAHEIVPLVVDVIWKKMEKMNEFILPRVNLSCVHAHILVGPSWQKSKVLDGAVLSTTSSQLSVLARSPGPYRALLIHGDLQLTYKHKGQQVKQKTVTIHKEPVTESKEAVWLRELQSIINELTIQVFIVSGLASESVYDLCDNMNVVLLTKVPYSLLVTLGDIYQVNYVKYFMEATEEDVLYPVTVEAYDDEWRNTMCPSARTHFVSISTSTELIQTAVICHPSQNVAMLREEQFWHCIKRLVSCIHSNKMLPGGGATEQCCAAHLKSYADTLLASDSVATSYQATVYRTVAEGFEQFAGIVSNNASGSDTYKELAAHLDGPNSDVFDDFQSKVEAWQTACHVTCQLLLADEVIITGFDVSHKNIAF